METIEMEVFSMAGNEPIIRLPGRCYPDCVIRRDELGIGYIYPGTREEIT